MTEQIKVKPLIIKIRIHKTPLCKQNYDVKRKLSMIHIKQYLDKAKLKEVSPFRVLYVARIMGIDHKQKACNAPVA